MDTRLPRVRPHEVGLNAASILTFVKEAEKQFGMHGFEVLRHGKVAACGWWKPYREEDTHVLFSMSKTFTATAIGIAMGEGLLSLSDRVLSFFPDVLPLAPCAGMEAMEVRHLLNMTTGHSAEPSFDGKGTWVSQFLSSYVDRDPGTWWCYNSAATYMLSAIVQRVTGQKVTDYLKPRLFDPLGIDTYWWEESPEGIQTGGYGFNTRLETLAKLGQLYLQKGVWEGKRLLPEGWTEELSKNRIPTLTAHHRQARLGYGYQVWCCSEPGSFRGDGAFGQFSVVLPEKDMVLAINAGEEHLLDILELAFETILPVVDTVSDSDTEEELRTYTASLMYALPHGDDNPQMEWRVHRKRYDFAPNRLGLESLMVSFGEEAVLHLTVDGKESAIPMGKEQWCYGQTQAPWDASSIGTFVFQDTAASYCWKEDQLIVTISYHKTPYVDTFELSFDRFGVVLQYERNVSFGERFATLYGRPREELFERYAWKAIVKEGQLSEYRRRHDAIWPSLCRVLKEAGIQNYTIWNVGNELFGYYECDKGIDFAAKVQAESAVVDEWNAYMKDVMVMELDPETGAQPLMQQVFKFE